MITLTDDNILYWTPGKGLDAFIAVEVMGYWQAEWNGESGHWFQHHASLPGEGMHASIGYPVQSCWGDSLPKFSTDIGAAWVLHEFCCKWIFSQRRVYLDNLQEAISDRLHHEYPEDSAFARVRVAWPDALIFLQPVDIAHAALMAQRRRQEREVRGIINA